MPYAAQRQNLFGYMLNFGAPSLHNYYLQAMLMIQVYVRGRHHLLPGVVLDVIDALGEPWFVMIVDNG